MEWLVVLIGGLALGLTYYFTLRPGDREPYRGHKVLSVNGETALVAVYEYDIVAQNPFPDLCIGDVVHVNEQGSGFSPYWVITKVYK
jgi:hypothetical protein